MEADHNLVGKGVFSHVLKCFNKKDLFKLRAINKDLSEHLRDYILKNAKMKVHQMTIDEAQVDHLKNCRELKIRGIQLDKKSVELFEMIPAETAEKMDHLTWEMTTDDADEEICKTLVELLGKFKSLKSLKILIWENSHVGNFFKLLHEEDSHPIFGSLKQLQVIVHKNCKGHEELSKFINKCSVLETIWTFPREEFNPFGEISDDHHINHVKLYTPEKDEHLDMYRTFLEQNKTKKLEIYGIRVDGADYGDIKFPSDLRDVWLNHMPQVNVDGIIKNLPPLTKLRLHDLGWDAGKYTSAIDHITKWDSLGHLELENMEFEDDAPWIESTKLIAESFANSIEHLSLGKNHISMEALKDIFINLDKCNIIRTIDLRDMRTYKDYKWENLLEALSVIGNNKERKHNITVIWSDDYFDYYETDVSRSESIDKAIGIKGVNVQLMASDL